MIERDIRINSHHHPELTMRTLRTINEHRLRIIDRHIERHNRARTRAHRHEAAMDAGSRRIGSLNRLARLRERGLCDCVVDLRELKLQDVTRVGLDFGGREDERFIDGRRADDDGYYL